MPKTEDATTTPGEELFWAARHGRAETIKTLVADGCTELEWAHPEDGRTPVGAARTEANRPAPGMMLSLSRANCVSGV